MPLNPSVNPVFSDQLPKLDENSTAHADTWNQVHQPLLNNDVYLRNSIQSVNQALGGKVQDLDTRLLGVEASSAVAVQSAVDLAWVYGGNVVKFEMFTSGYTLIDVQPLAVVQGVNGDDSVDVASTASLRAGEFYVLSDTAAKVSALVQIQTILSGSRIRLSANLARDWGATATLRRCSFDVQGARRAVAAPGDIYLSRSINIGTDQSGGAVVIRRTHNSGLARLYYRDGYQAAWKECGWSQRRTGGDVPAGYADYEYILPMRGDGWLRVDVQGEPITVAHIVALGQSTGLGGYVNPDLRPNTPVLSAPANNAAGVMERPSLTIAGYSSPAGNAQAALQVQLATVADFSVVLHDSGVQPAGVSYTLPAGVISAGVLYRWRFRVQDVAGLWSDWMTVASFTTAASFAYVVPASITGPAANATDVPEQPTVTLSAFATVGGADTHKSSQLQIRAADGTYSTPVYDSGADTVNKLSMVIPAGKLKAGLNFYLRARQEGTNRGWGEYGPEIKITTKTQFANVIGIALLATGGGSGSWARIDENGANKVVDAAFFSSHATYGAVQDVIIDEQIMVRVPAFYVKTGVVSGGANNGKRAWWVSDQPLPGYSLHPAFMDAGAPISQFWVGKYQATNASTKLESKSAGEPTRGLNLSSMREMAYRRNVSGVTGFSIWNIHQLQAIQLLALIEMGGADSQALVGQGVVTGGVFSVSNAQVITANWRGVLGLWGNVFQLVDGVGVDAGTNYKIWDKSGSKSWVTTSQAVPVAGYPVTLSTASGVGYDLSFGFLPATVDSSSSNGTVADYVYKGANSEIVHGGSYANGFNAGLFCLWLGVLDSGSGDIGTRLAKV